MITEEMVDDALAASGKIRRHLDPTGRIRMRAAIEAALAKYKPPRDTEMTFLDRERIVAESMAAIKTKSGQVTT